jgi:hypothetical protein
MAGIRRRLRIVSPQLLVWHPFTCKRVRLKEDMKSEKF